MQLKNALVPWSSFTISFHYFKGFVLHECRNSSSKSLFDWILNNKLIYYSSCKNELFSNFHHCIWSVDPRLSWESATSERFLITDFLIYQRWVYELNRIQERKQNKTIVLKILALSWFCYKPRKSFLGILISSSWTGQLPSIFFKGANRLKYHMELTGINTDV